MNNDPTTPAADQLHPDPAGKIHWAVSPLEEKLDALKARHWLSEDLIQFSMKHWRCSRQHAVERLLADVIV